jgi:hypothetical protein
MRADGCKVVAGALKGKNALTELNIAKNNMTYGSGWGDISAVIALVGAIPDMGALTSLNLSSNNLKAEGAKIVAGAIKVTNCEIAVGLVSFSCPSDHWLYSCCLLPSTGPRGVDQARYQQQ